MVGVGSFLGGDPGTGIVMLLLGGILVLDRQATREQFKSGWARGFNDAMWAFHEAGQHKVPEIVTRQLIHGTVIPEPWDPAREPPNFVVNMTWTKRDGTDD